MIPSQASVTELYGYTYDSMGRLKSTTHALNGSSPVTLSDLSYNDLGQVSSKRMTGGIETSGYAYNLRGWLTSIDGSKFSEKIWYEESPSGTKNFNGNISEMEYKMPGSSAFDRYRLSYDNLDRMTSAAFTGATGTNIYDESVSYDKMGNILTLQRKGRMDKCKREQERLPPPNI